MFVFGSARVALDMDYDRLQNLVNNHAALRKVVGHGEQDGQLWLHCEINQGRGKPKLKGRVNAETVVRLRLKLVQKYLRVQSRHGGDSELDLLQTLVDSVAPTRGAAGH